MKVLIPLAEGFEEIEAVTVIDLLRRADIHAVTAALKKNPVSGTHDILVTADCLLSKVISEIVNFDAIVLPGGMPGSANLKNDPRIINIIKQINKSGGLTAAICAAPIVLSEAKILTGKKFTCYPGYEDEITEGIFTDESVASDGSIITCKGAGLATLFALAIIEFIKDKETAKRIKEQVMSA